MRVGLLTRYRLLVAALRWSASQLVAVAVSPLWIIALRPSLVNNVGSRFSNSVLFLVGGKVSSDERFDPNGFGATIFPHLYDFSACGFTWAPLVSYIRYLSCKHSIQYSLNGQPISKPTVAKMYSKYILALCCLGSVLASNASLIGPTIVLFL